MKRLEFIKKLFTVSAIVAVAPDVLAKTETKNEYSFDEIFEVSKGNDRLVYPKKDSPVYQEIIESISGKINQKATPTYLPVQHLSIPVKEKYTREDLKPLQFYFESVYGRMERSYAVQKGVVFRMIKDLPDRMHLDVFLNYRY